MPKKFKGENSKAVEAKARKAAVQKEKQDEKQKAVEDEFWKDDDKGLARKQQRKDDKEKKRLEQLERKKELAKLQDEELALIKTAKPAAATKMSRAEIETKQETLRQEAAAAQQKEKTLLHHERPIEDNVNKLVTEGEEARGIEEAISVLSIKEPEEEKHPEKRMKAAYIKFEEENLPLLKTENPNMRLSQLKQMLKKDWMKSPENPLNWQTKAYNTK